MNKKELIVLWFGYNDLTFSKFEQIFSKFNDLEDILTIKNIKNADFDKSIVEIVKKLRSENLDKFEKKVMAEMDKYKILPVTYFSNAYPEKLKNISDPPLVLYTKGDVTLLSKDSISIVGTRKPTTYGRIVCENFTKELSRAGLVTISGLAYGIDTIVAQKTLEIDGKTIAVLAGGLDSIYPPQNTGLANKIIENGGLLVTEYKPGHKPLQFQFIRRNRIVSALGLGTLIVEAGKSSGTMSTANFTLEQSRELFVIPGNITSPQSEGTNALIDQMPDIFTVSPSRILYKLNIKVQKPNEEKSKQQADLVQSKILEILEDGEKTFDEICDLLNISASMLSTKLITMEMFGLVKKGDGNKYYKL